MEKHKIKSVSIFFDSGINYISSNYNFSIIHNTGGIHKKNYPFIGDTANPVGVGQQTLFHAGITDELQKRCRRLWRHNINS